jgi:hypothetical protein
MQGAGCKHRQMKVFCQCREPVYGYGLVLNHTHSVTSLLPQVMELTRTLTLAGSEKFLTNLELMAKVNNVTTL